jgi:Fe-S-cluster containining protein
MFLKKENELDFSCQSCGNCCRYFSINLTHLDIERITENRPDLKATDFVAFETSDEKDDHESFISTYGKRQIILKKKPNSKECVFLENNKCSIHAFKPRVCKVWPFSLDKGNITWIKEHKSFIKKLCKHTSVTGANNPDELIPLIKMHYKERKIFSKIVQKWNDEKKKEIKGDEIFSNILDEDFLNFILKEINIRKQAEVDTANEEDFLSKILTGLISERMIEVITETQSGNIYANSRHPDITLNIYIQENNIEAFFNEENLKKLQEKFESDFFVSYNNSYSSKRISFYIKGKFFYLYLYSYLDIYKPQPFDTRVLYNPYAIDIKIQPFQEQMNQELVDIYKKFWFKIIEAQNYIREQNYLDGKFLLNSAVNQELSSLIYWLNKKNFTLLDIPFLNNKTEDIKEFLIDFSNYKSEENSLVGFIKSLVDIFNKNWKLTNITVNEPFINDIIINFDLK